jgi:hypothetical protein
MGDVIRIADYERRDPDAVSPRDPADSAIIIILPVVRIERFGEDDEDGNIEHQAVTK